MKNIIDTRAIIVNLFKEDKKTYLSLKRLQKVLSYIYNELASEGELKNYDTYFDLNFDAIERTVMYNNKIFKLDVYGDMIYLAENNDVSVLVEEYSVDYKINQIISDFVQNNIA